MIESLKKLDRSADILLEISSILMQSGANTNRVNLNVDRYASVLDCSASCLISHKTIVLTIKDNMNGNNYTKTKNIPPYLLNFSTISQVSLGSWKAMDENWTIEEIESEIEKIKEKKRFPRILVLLAVSFAGAGFCNIFGGDYLNMTVAFVCTFIGLFIFQFAAQKKYNLYLRVFFGSFTASVLACIGILFNLGANPQTALATSVLFLVPGVPLINSFTDLMDNNILNGLVRFSVGIMTVLFIALGLFAAMVIFHLKIA